jgi:sortase A
MLWVGFVTIQARVYDVVERRRFEQLRDPAALLADLGASDGGDVLVGILEIPRLRFSEVVAEGDDDGTLRVAVGHLLDTPLPWQPGNSALAGHRDGRFRPLKNARPGDRIRLLTRFGDLDYVLRNTAIVDPDDMSVLAPSSSRTLTLITCYPFSYVGAAPKRFVIRADAVNDSTTTAPASR